MRISLYSCAGCPAVTSQAKNFARYRGDRWCLTCRELLRQGKPTPKDEAKATGGDTRNGLTRALDAWGKDP